MTQTLTRPHEPRSDDAFETALRELSTRYWDTHPFHRRLHNGTLTRQELQIWAANRWYYQRCLPQKDAAIIANCPLPDVRRWWAERIAYHDGSEPGTGGADNWLRLAEAVGLDRTEVLEERHLLPGVRFAVDAYVTFAKTKPWIEAVASGLTEMFAPGLLLRRLSDMRDHYPWIAEKGFAYFVSRLRVISGEGKSTLDVVLRHCTTRVEQDAAIAALSFKCDVLRAILDSIDYACQEAAA